MLDTLIFIIIRAEAFFNKVRNEQWPISQPTPPLIARPGPCSPASKLSYLKKPSMPEYQSCYLL